MNLGRRNVKSIPCVPLAMMLLFVAGCSSTDSQSSTAPSAANVAENTEQAKADTARAVELIQSRSYKEAQTLLERAIAADPMYGPAHNDLGLVHAAQSEVYPAAVEYRNAIKLMPRQPQPLNNLGLVLESAGKLTEAEQYYSQAVSLDPDNPEYTGNLARARVQLGEHDKALTDLLARIVLYDSRPQWAEWAQNMLLKQSQPTTLPLTLP